MLSESFLRTRIVGDRTRVVDDRTRIVGDMAAGETAALLRDGVAAGRGG
jgi:hypothetical protein